MFPELGRNLRGTVFASFWNGYNNTFVPKSRRNRRSAIRLRMRSNIRGNVIYFG